MARVEVKRPNSMETQAPVRELRYLETESWSCHHTLFPDVVAQID